MAFPRIIRSSEEYTNLILEFLGRQPLDRSFKIPKLDILVTGIYRSEDGFLNVSYDDDGYGRIQKLFLPLNVYRKTVEGKEAIRNKRIKKRRKIALKKLEARKNKIK